jgi:hypothetical protein|tara:strand:+ start:4632 stop:5036 length:405 start_codon:yes stop_codon:yes gene_type:complete
MNDYNKFKANFEYQQKVAAKGFGDTVEKITKATGIKKVVDTVAEALDADCGCDKRKKKLNELFPYKIPELFTEQEFLYLKDIFKEKKNNITEYAPKMLKIYNRVFKDTKKLTNCSPCFVGQVYNKLEAIYNEYK